MYSVSQKFIDVFISMPISCTATLLYHQHLPINISNEAQIINHPIIHTRRIQLVHGCVSPILPVASLEDEGPSIKPEDEYKLLLSPGKCASENWTRTRALLKFTTWGDPHVKEDIIKGRSKLCQETTDRYVRANGIDAVIRAHEDTKNGFYFPVHNGKIATIFSSDTYGGL